MDGWMGGGMLIWVAIGAVIVALLTLVIAKTSRK
jgi:hypothetical protein